MNRKYILARVYSDNPCKAFALGNNHDGPEVFDDWRDAEAVKQLLPRPESCDDELGWCYCPARLITAQEIDLMDNLGYQIAWLPDNTPIAIMI